MAPTSAAGIQHRILFVNRLLFASNKPTTFKNLRFVSTTDEDGEPRKHLNKGRLDFLFGDGYRRPLADDQGGKIRKNWIPFGFHPTNEYVDWYRWHKHVFIFVGIVIPGIIFGLWYKSDWPEYQVWGWREAYMEIERREKAGLPLISKDLFDPKVVAATLPTDEELGDFKIVI